VAREATNRLLEMCDEGIMDKDQVILACVNYMSEDDVADMCHINGFFEHEQTECDECGLPTEVDDDGLCNSCAEVGQ
jgi:hypothetical protein